MRPDKIMISVGVFILFCLVGYAFLFAGADDGTKGGLFIEYGTDVDEEKFYNVTSGVGGVYNISKDMNQAVLEEQLEAETGWENMIIGSYKAFKDFVGMFGVVAQMFGNVIIMLGVPPIFLQIGMTIFRIVVVFIFIYMIFRFMPRDN